MKLRKITALTCALTLAFQLAACGGAEQKETTAPQAETEAAADAGDVVTAEFTYEDLSDGTIKLTGFSGTEADVTIPASIDGKTVTEIGESCFAGSLSLQTIHVPEGVTAIDDYAFECCSYLRKAYLPESLVSIGAGAFSGCVELVLADMQDNVETIGDGAFMHCTSLVYVELPANLKELGEFAFNWCRSLTTVTFRGDACTEIKERTFGDCIKLAAITMPGQLAEIGEYAFLNCSELDSVYITDTVQEIGKSAFQGCESLSLFSFPCEVLRTDTFKNCTALSYIGFSDNLKTIEATAISGANSLSQLDLPSGIEEIDEAALIGGALTGVTLEDNANYVVSDGSLYTADMKELIQYFPADPYAEEEQTEFTVPDGVEVIGDYAFYQCMLEKIVLPDSVKEIGEHAFNESSVCELVVPDGLEIPESAIEHCYGLGYEEPQSERAADEEFEYDVEGIPTLEEVIASYEDAASYRYVTNEEYDDWAAEYVSYNSDIVVPDSIHNHYITMYKGQVPAHYKGMTAVQNDDPDLTAQAEERFGTGFEALYLMMDHGMEVEISRFKVQGNMILFSGVYDSQLMAAAGSDTVPTIEELQNCAGNTFTDPIQISTTTDPTIAANFGDTLFIIFAGQDNINALGGVCMDAYMGTNEKELLMVKNAEYKVIGAGTMQISATDWEGNEAALVRDYVMVELVN